LVTVVRRREGAGAVGGEGAANSCQLDLPDQGAGPVPGPLTLPMVINLTPSDFRPCSRGA